MLVKGDTKSLVVKGNGGIGKSYVVMKELDELGLKEGINYRYISGHVTPLKLFNVISQSVTLENPKLLVFDDIDSLVTNRTSIALLKASLWEVRGKRVVTYDSSSGKIDGPTSVEFEGRTLLILNDLKQEGAFGKPLLDRCVVYDMSLTHKELIEYIDTILPDINSPIKPEVRKEIWQQIKQFSANQRFSVRSVVRAFDFYHYDKKSWLPMFINSLSLTSDQKIYYEIESGQNKTQRERAKEFSKRTGKSTRSYYRVK